MTSQSNQRSSKRSTASESSARNHKDDVFISQLGVTPHSPSKHEFSSPESFGRSNFFTGANSDIQGHSLNQRQAKQTETFSPSLDYAANANINPESTAYDLQQQSEHFHSMYDNQQPNYQHDVFSDDNKNTYNLMPQAANDMVSSLGKRVRDQEPEAPMPDSQVGNPVASLSLLDNKETPPNFSSLPAAKTSARKKLKKIKKMDDEYMPIQLTKDANGPPSPVPRKKKLGRLRKIRSATESSANTSTTKAPKAPKDAKPPKVTKETKKKTKATATKLQEANVAPTALRKSVKRKAALAALEEIERRSPEIVEEYFENTSPLSPLPPASVKYEVIVIDSDSDSSGPVAVHDKQVHENTSPLSPLPPASVKYEVIVIDSDSDSSGPVVVHDKQVHGSYFAADSAIQPIVKRRRRHNPFKIIGVNDKQVHGSYFATESAIQRIVKRRRRHNPFKIIGVDDKETSQEQFMSLEKVIEREKTYPSLQSVDNTVTSSETSSVPSPALAPSSPVKVSIFTTEENSLQQEIDRLLHSKESELATADLKHILRGLLNTLPDEDLAEAAELLPWTDKDSHGAISHKFGSPSNNFFWESVENWQVLLSLGGFEEKKGDESTSVQTSDAPSFKDEAYENYWGERLESTRRLRLSREKKRSSKSYRRVPARGRGRGSK